MQIFNLILNIYILEKNIFVLKSIRIASNVRIPRQFVLSYMISEHFF